MLYTICFMSTGGVTIEADSEAEALKKFYSDAVQEEVGKELAMNEIDITEVYEEVD